MKRVDLILNTIFRFTGTRNILLDKNCLIGYTAHTDVNTQVLEKLDTALHTIPVYPNENVNEALLGLRTKIYETD